MPMYRVVLAMRQRWGPCRVARISPQLLRGEKPSQSRVEARKALMPLPLVRSGGCTREFFRSEALATSTPL